MHSTDGGRFGKGARFDPNVSADNSQKSAIFEQVALKLFEI